MKHGSLFNGIGGFQLAASWMGWENVFSCEIDEWCNKVTKQHFQNCIQHGDIKQTDFTIYRGNIDFLSGGFPCQDISVSGLGAGIDGVKSGLWSEFRRAANEINPKNILIENSPNLTKKGFEKVLVDLAEIGYDAEWECLSASDFGFDHIRSRIWILAYPTSQRRRGILHMLKRSLVEKNRETNPLDTSRHPFLRFEERNSEPSVFGMADGLPKRLDVVKRLGGAGNAVVPYIPFEIFKAIDLTTN